MALVVPVSFAEVSKRALEFAVEIALKMGHTIVLVHSLYGGTKTLPDDIKKAEKLLDDAHKTAIEMGVRAEKRLLIRGNTPGEDIVEVAEEVKAEMIVMGCGIIQTDYGPVLSKTTEFVVLNSRKPILLVKG